MFADMWLGSDRARQLEIDAKKQPAETDKKKNKSTKSKPKEEKPKPRQKEAEKNQVRVCCLVPYFSVSVIFGYLHGQYKHLL